MNRFLLLISFLLGLYVLLCGLLYFLQEKLIFFPQKLDSDYRFTFQQRFKEVSIKTDDNEKLHGLLFMVEKPKGLIFYLHGNAGSWRDGVK